MCHQGSSQGSSTKQQLGKCGLRSPCQTLLCPLSNTVAVAQHRRTWQPHFHGTAWCGASNGHHEANNDSASTTNILNQHSR